MVFKNILLILALVFFNQQLVEAQSNTPSTRLNAILITGTFSFSSQGNEAFSIFDNNVRTLTMNTSYLHFIANKFAIGTNLSFRHTKYSWDGKNIAWDLGPKVAYYFDNGSNYIPYLSMSVGYLSNKTWDSGYTFESTGYKTDFNGGLAIRKGHLLFLLETGFIYEKVKSDFSDDSVSGSTFYLSVGFGASLYPDEGE